MMTGVLIWGQEFLDEIGKPHPDPEIRAMEALHAKWSHEMLMRMFEPVKFDNNRWLPRHYAK